MTHPQQPNPGPAELRAKTAWLLVDRPASSRPDLGRCLPTDPVLQYSSGSAIRLGTGSIYSTHSRAADCLRAPTNAFIRIVAHLAQQCFRREILSIKGREECAKRMEPNRRILVVGQLTQSRDQVLQIVQLERQLTKNPRTNRNELGIPRIEQGQQLGYISAAPKLIYESA